MILSMATQKNAVIIEGEIGTEIEIETDAEAGVGAGQEMMVEIDRDGVDLETEYIRETEMKTKETVGDENYPYIGMFLRPGMNT